MHNLDYAWITCSIIPDFSAHPMQSCAENSLISHERSYISSRSSSEDRCQPHTISSQFYVTAKQGQRVQISYYLLNQELRDNSTKQIGYVIDEGKDKVYPLNISDHQEGTLMVTQSKDVTVSINPDNQSHFLIFFQGEDDKCLSDAPLIAKFSPFCLSATLKACILCQMW